MRRGAVCVLGLLLAAWAGWSEAAARPSFEELLANLKSPNAKTRQEAATQLGESRRREAVLPLAALVRDPEPRVRLEVVRSLRQLRDQNAVPALVTSLRDGDPRIREEAIGGIVEIFGAKDYKPAPVEKFLATFSDEHERAAIASFVQVDASVYDGLASLLRDEEPNLRREAALALGILDGRSKLRDLKASLGDPDPGVRAAAAGAIGKVGAEADGEPLIPMLSDESADVRARALRAIGVLKVTKAGPTLRQMFEATRQKETQLRLLETLSRLDDKRQEDLFRSLVQDPDGVRRRLAIEGLARVADTSLLVPLKKDYQRARDEDIRLALAFALTRLGDTAFVDSLVLCLPTGRGQRCHDYLIEAGAGLLDELYPYLQDPDAQIRARLCDIMAELGDPSAIRYVEPLIGDPSPEVGDAANRAAEHLRRLQAR